MRRTFGLLLLVLIACLANGQDSDGGKFRIEGTVKDTTGAVIPGAVVQLRSGSFSSSQVTDTAGEFVFGSVPTLSGALLVRAHGFEPLEQPWQAQGPVSKVELALRPASIAEQMTVTAARTPTRVLDSPATAVVLSSQDLLSAGTVTLDDTLREVPGFSLFRRSGSRTANPTSQGVSLRGLGASGASRALVISDDKPLNDPFGGWVYWDRIPHAAVESVEVIAGGASPLYGGDALGGVVNIIRRPVDRSALTLYSSYGNEQTPDTSLFGSENYGPWFGAVDTEVFHTDGYIPVPLGLRGRADSFASSEYITGDLTVERKLGDRGRAYLRGSSFGESRDNGTVLQRNRTTIRELDLGGDWKSDSIGQFSAVGYVGRQFLNQSFSSVSQNRNTETLTRLQRVPAQPLGMDIQWTRPAGSRQTLVAGVEAHEFRGESDEFAISKNVATTAVDNGGRQHNVGVFGEDIIQVTSRWILTAIARVDHWTNFDAFSSTQPLLPSPGTVVRTPLPQREETFFSPRLGSLYRLTPRVALTASAYRSFRAPTLNELYRSFRQGNNFTEANNQLVAERLTGVEGGATVTGFNQRLLVRGNFFWADITRPIENVTLSTTPALITLQRQNLGRARAPGLEFEAETRVNSALTLSGGFQFVDARVVSFPNAPVVSLQGLEIPQVPRHVFTVQARYFKPHWILLGVQGRFVGVQYDNDQNTFLLRRFFTMDLMASHPLTSALDVFLAADNLLNQRYDIAQNPLNVAPPILARVGLRLNLGAR
jgi:outer membrane receptor protein involved in Fe transport